MCLWQAGKYEDSLKHLETLQELNKEDYKIPMNRAVVEFYKTGQSTTGTFKQTLMMLKNQVTLLLTWIITIDMTPFKQINNNPFFVYVKMCIVAQSTCRS